LSNLSDYFLFMFLPHLAQSASWGIVGGGWLRCPATCIKRHCASSCVIMRRHASSTIASKIFFS